MVHRWEPFTVAGLVEFLAPVAVPWWLSGGYALEEFLGRSTRAHGDIDVPVARRDWPAMQAALRPVLDVFVARDGALACTRRLEPAGETEMTVESRRYGARQAGAR